MADDRDPAEFLKSHGVTPRSQSGAPPEVEVSPTPDPPTRNEGAFRTQYHEASRGFLRGLGGLAATAAEYAGYASPLTTGFGEDIGEYVRQHPYYQDVRQFADTPDASTAETVGRVAGQAAGTSVIPGMGVGGVTTGFLRPSLGRLAPTVGNLAERAFKGAAGGALADPEHPGSAAAGGAAAGLIPGAGGAALRSRVMRGLGGLLAVEGTWYAAHKAFDVPFYPIAGPLIVWHSGPIGRMLRRAGNKIMDNTGKVVGHIPAGAMGYFAGPTVGQGAREAPNYLPGQEPTERPGPGPAAPPSPPPSVVRKPPEVDPTATRRRPFTLRDEDYPDAEKPRP